MEGHRMEKDRIVGGETAEGGRQSPSARPTPAAALAADALRLARLAQELRCPPDARNLLLRAARWMEALADAAQ